MRKTIGVLIAIFMLFGFMSFSINSAEAAGAPIAVAKPLIMPAEDFSHAYISQEKALEILQATFPDIITGKELETEFSESGHGNNPCWEFKLKGDRESIGLSGSELIADVNALTGEIINFYYNPRDDYYRGRAVQLTREQAYPIAKEFLQKIQPEKAATMQFQESITQYYDSQTKIAMYYNFYWYRQVNGIKVDWDNTYIGVDAFTGKVTHYTFNWHDAEFPEIGKPLSKADLTANLLNEAGLYPLYVEKAGDTASATFSPVYRLNTNSPFYDAQTGDLLNQSGANLAEKDKRIFEETFSPQPNTIRLATPSPPNQKINPELAKKSAEELFKKMGIVGELRRSGGGSSSGPGYNEEFWNYSLVENNNNRFGNGPEVSINVHTGQIKSFRNYTGQEQPGEISLGYEEALNKAWDYIENMNPEIKDQLILQKQLWDQEPDDAYYFNFARLLNGISCSGGIRVEISKYSKQLCSYDIDWYPIKLINHSNIITPQKAKEIFQSQQPFELAYIFPINSDRAYGSSQVRDPLLVYRNTELYQLDALSGEMTGWRMENKPSGNQNDYSQHWAAAALSLLNETGLIEKNIKPDDTLTRRQALKILTATVKTNYYNEAQHINLAFTDIEANDPDLTVFQQAVKKGIINNQGKLKPEQNINREELSVWLVNCLSYQEIAQMKNAIALPFKDVDQITGDKTNYVGLIDGLGLLSADSEQNFRPQAAVTWAEMATAATQLATRIK